MNFNDLGEISQTGFQGFETMGELFTNSSHLPNTKGVYLILNIKKEPPSYLEIGSGGFFKGRNPNVSLDELARNWVKDALVVYIGKAGGDISKATLKSRLRQYFGFGQGKNIGHWGGRLVWQLADSENLVVCWKPLNDADPRAYEVKLINDFVDQFGARPFANLAS